MNDEKKMSKKERKAYEKKQRRVESRKLKRQNKHGDSFMIVRERHKEAVKNKKLKLKYARLINYSTSIHVYYYIIRFLLWLLGTITPLLLSQDNCFLSVLILRNK